LGDELYGTTSGGGTNGAGTVFAIDAAGKERIVYSFAGGADGGYPQGYFVAGDGELYGITEYGGDPRYEFGGVFVFDPESGRERIVHAFTGERDGEYPSSVAVGNGQLYVAVGGVEGASPDFGAIVAIEPSSGRTRVLHSFAGYPTDGAYPNSLLYTNGTLFGTTAGGGLPNPFIVKCGTVYALSPLNTKEQILWSWGGVNDPCGPSGPILATKNALYMPDGNPEFNPPIPISGTIFRLARSGGSVLHFFGPGDGRGPLGPLLGLGANSGAGVTNAGGAYGFGTVFTGAL
jgi:uncharacterized repeat protein (TIGR03803 family)